MTNGRIFTDICRAVKTVFVDDAEVVVRRPNSITVTSGEEVLLKARRQCQDVLQAEGSDVFLRWKELKHTLNRGFNEARKLEQQAAFLRQELREIKQKAETGG
jgi:hypothetical protein